MKIDDSASELIYFAIKFNDTFDIEKIKFFWNDES